jgi:phosphohistidine swiveling domain-containing protein
MSGFAFDEIPANGQSEEAESADLLGRSVGVSRAFSGVVRVADEQFSPEQLLEGEILVTAACPTQWRPWLGLLRGVIIDAAEADEHLLQASRELDLPVVDLVPGLIDGLSSGAIIDCSATGQINLLDERRRPDSPMRTAVPAARQSRLRLEEGPGHFGAAASLSVVDGKPAGDTPDEQ